MPRGLTTIGSPGGVAYVLCGDRGRAEDATRIRSGSSIRPHRRYSRVTAQRQWPDAPILVDDQVVDRDRLVQALRRLPYGQRVVSVPRHWHQLPESEIARIVGNSVGTVKSQPVNGPSSSARPPSSTRPASARERRNVSSATILTGDAINSRFALVREYWSIEPSLMLDFLSAADETTDMADLLHRRPIIVPYSADMVNQVRIDRDAIIPN
jgi:hypothetical protein